jgi:hypothetical protein
MDQVVPLICAECGTFSEGEVEGLACVHGRWA